MEYNDENLKYQEILDLNKLMTYRRNPFIIKSICREDIIDCVINMHLSNYKTEQYIKFIDNISNDKMKEIADKIISELNQKHDYLEYLQCLFEDITNELIVEMEM